MKPWIPKTFDEACRRAAGRRRYHAKRRQIRDARQMMVMKELLKLNWKSYGAGRILAKTFRVDPATISRDIRYILNWRRRFLKQFQLNQTDADAIIQRMIFAGLHPRIAISFTFTYENGGQNLTVRRTYRYGHSRFKTCGIGFSKVTSA